MERYEAYKDSGVDWLGEIPVGWEIKKLKYGVSKVGSGVTPSGGASTYQLSGIPLLRSQNIHVDGIKMDDVAYIDEKLHDSMCNSKVQAGDVLLNITGASIGRCFYADENLGEANVNQHVCIIRPDDKIKTSYLYFILRSDLGEAQINIEQTGSGREGLNFEAVKNFVIPYFSVEEQTAIANFLDRKTAEIDALITQKERLLELYEEEKTVIINHTVTKGLDSNAELKDSGVDWLGEIPVGWQLKNLKHVTIHGLQNGIFKKGTDFGSGIKLINVGDIYTHNFLIDENSLERVACTASEETKYEVNTGDIFFVRSSLKRDGIAKTACLEGRNESIVFECHLIKITPKDIAHQYLNYYLNSDLLRHKLISLSITTTMTTISQDAIGSVEVNIPSSKEQTAIVQYINTETARIDAKIIKTQRIIELQKEYRTALISEVVTGKIKVPELSTQETSV